jgi:hypothetical protein
VNPDDYPTVTQTACHFSSSCDLERARLYLHYQERQSQTPHHIYKTKRIIECDLGDEGSIATWQTYMRGIYDFVIGARLTVYQNGFVRLARAAGTGPGIDDTTTATGSSDSASVSVPTQF